MSCPTQKRLCKRLIISNSVTYASSGNTLLINIPQAAYNNGEKYCIVVGQSIPDGTTISASVGVTIGSAATVYPLVNPDCTATQACAINSRTRYSTEVVTTTTSGSFRLLGKIPCSQCVNNLPSIPV